MQKPSRLYLARPDRGRRARVQRVQRRQRLVGGDYRRGAATTAAAAPSDTSSGGGATSTLDPIVGNVDLGPLAGCPFFTKADAEAFLGQDVGDVNMKGSQVKDDTILAMSAYNDLSGVAENGVSVSAKLVPGSGQICRAICSTSSRTGSPDSRSRRSPVSVMALAPRCSPAATSSSSSCSPGSTSSTSRPGPNKTLDEVVALARETIPKLPEPPNSD